MLGRGGPAWIIAGLGNPGREYEKTRHNTGFRVLDLLAARTGTRVDRLRFRALTGRAVLAGQSVLLMKPQTYMNLSGESVRAAADYFHIPPERVLILYDDTALPVGRVRVRPGGSAGGHNGMKSLIAQLGTQDFPRVRIGVGEKPHPDYDLADWVLSTLSAGDEKRLADALERAADAAEEVLRSGCESAMSRYNGAG